MSEDNKSLFNQIRDNDHQDDDKCHMFFDWFCADSSLERRAKPLMALVKKIAFSQKFDATNVYAFFKNNCPMSGGTYDQFSLCDLESGEVQFCIQNRGHEWQLFARAEGFEKPVVDGTKKQVVDWFMQ